MRTTQSTKILLLPRLSGLGGMVSFQGRLAAGLAARGVLTTFDETEPGISAALMVGGTRRLDVLYSLRRRGIPIVQRLNGMNWIHRRMNTGLRHWLRSETNNLTLAFIRRSLASEVVYQSRFSQEWWERVYRPTGKPCRVVYNGVDLSKFSPHGEGGLPEGSPPQDRFRILLVEGRLGGANLPGLENAFGLVDRLQKLVPQQVELAVAGEVPASLQAASTPGGVPLRWEGVVPAGRIPELDRSAHLLFSADLNAACPNSVIEALACGLPVVAFDTGALGEMLQGGAGEVVPYGGNHWKLEAPDLDSLAGAAARMLANLPAYRLAARARAEAAFSLEQMVSGYLAALTGPPPQL
jgi:glycosyltransferase involved in cell wall biosynthesis